MFCERTKIGHFPPLIRHLERFDVGWVLVNSVQNATWLERIPARLYPIKSILARWVATISCRRQSEPIILLKHPRRPLLIQLILSGFPTATSMSWNRYAVEAGITAKSILCFRSSTLTESHKFDFAGSRMRRVYLPLAPPSLLSAYGTRISQDPIEHRFFCHHGETQDSSQSYL